MNFSFDSLRKRKPIAADSEWGTQITSETLNSMLQQNPELAKRIGRVPIQEITSMETKLPIPEQPTSTTES